MRILRTLFRYRGVELQPAHGALQKRGKPGDGKTLWMDAVCVFAIFRNLVSKIGGADPCVWRCFGYAGFQRFFNAPMYGFGQRGQPFGQCFGRVSHTTAAHAHIGLGAIRLFDVVDLVPKCQKLFCV